MVAINIQGSFDKDYFDFAIGHYADFQEKYDGIIDLDISFGKVFSVKRCNAKAYVCLVNKPQIFYALTMLFAEYADENFEYSKNTPFENISFMLDCSRCAVINFESYKKLIVLLAKLGYTSIELYTEDTYEIVDEPYFGHMRGRYSQTEIKEMDEFAARYGIELIPCIQTLAHLDNIFLWPRYEEIHDMWDCILIGEEKTYTLIDKMFRAISECFRSRKVNIGFDEAYYAGRGAYLDRYGYADKTDLLEKHLKRVLDIADKYGFKCKMYADMFFKNGVFTGQTFAQNVDFVYWDYYNTSKRHYDKAFAKYKTHVENISFASGMWKWLGVSPMNRYGMKRILPAMLSAKENGIKNVALTAWGDNGSECSVFAAMPQLMFFSSLCYGREVNILSLNTLSLLLTKIPIRNWLALDIPNGYKNSNYSVLTNPAKYLVYNDPLSGLMDYHIDEGYTAYYKKCVRIFRRIVNNTEEWKNLFNEQKTLCEFLSVKANMGNELQLLYLSGDKAELLKYAKTVVPKAIKKLNAFIAAFRETWYNDNKTFGFDVMELRLGGQKERLSEIILRITEYCDGKISKIEELEQPKLPFNYPNEKGLIYKHNSKYMISPFFPVV